MEKSILKSPLLFLFVFWGCGNYNFQRGEYQESALQYMEVLDSQEYSPYASFNLGNVYQALGEPRSALGQWETISLGDAPEELSYRVYFNFGVLFFQQGQYNLAYSHFKKALKMRPEDWDAKKNLELSLLKIQTPSSTENRNNSSGTRGGELGETQALLEYVERLERNQWKGRQELTTEENLRDW